MKISGFDMIPDIPLGGAERLHEPCRIFCSTFPPVFLANSYGYCLVKRTKICSQTISAASHALMENLG